MEIVFGSMEKRSTVCSVRLRLPVACMLSVLTCLFALLASADVQTALNFATQQLDYIANSNAAPPASKKDVSALTWSVQPSSTAKITEAGRWQDVADTSIIFSLQRAAIVVVDYDLVAKATKLYHPGGDFVNSRTQQLSSNGDFLATRLAVDGMPFRQSGSHVSPVSSLESSSRQLSGTVVVQLPKGNHSVKLQWKKWGHVVHSWSSSPGNPGHDGMSNYRSITVTSRHKYLWYAQPLTTGRIMGSQKGWHDVKDMTVSFSTPRKWTLRFIYHIQVSPQSAPNANVHAQPDFLSMRLVLDGVAYRETSALTTSFSRTYSTSSMTGEITLEVPPGTHKVVLQWRKWGTSVPVWWSHPHFLDGFVSGRSLIVMGEHHPVAYAQPMPDAALASSKNMTSNGWRDVHSTKISLTMPTPGKVTFSYIVSIANWGRPDWDAWTWAKWSAVGLRLVVDGLPFSESGTYADPSVRSTEDVEGDLTIDLPAGPHMAQLQWHAYGSSVKEWRSLQQILDGYAGSRQLLAVVTAAVKDTAFEGKLSSQHQKAAILRRMRLELGMASVTTQVIDDRRWKWLTSTNLTEWFRGYIKTLFD